MNGIPACQREAFCLGMLGIKLSILYGRNNKPNSHLNVSSIQYKGSRGCQQLQCSDKPPSCIDPLS